jgi:hypothetical protein
VNNLGQWLPAGRVTVTRGRHAVALVRGHGSLAPGDGYRGVLGPVTLVPEPAPRPAALVRVGRDRAGSLCGRPWDWIELVRPLP